MNPKMKISLEGFKAVSKGDPRIDRDRRAILVSEIIARGSEISQNPILVANAIEVFNESVFPDYVGLGLVYCLNEQRIRY